jgi:hypothetical protein
MRRLSPGALLLVVLAGCPLPQPLPDYPEGQPITPPRIVVDDNFHRVSQPETIVRVPADCTSPPSFSLRSMLRDASTLNVVARWFVNYRPDPASPSVRSEQEDEIGTASGAGGVDPSLRETPEFLFTPAGYAPIEGTGGGVGGAVGAVHVVELVVSNGFDPAADFVTAALPFRTPGVGFEVQVYRWVFLTVPKSPPSCTGTACVVCPDAEP